MLIHLGHLGRLHMRPAGQLEDQFPIQKLPAQPDSELLPYSCSSTAIFARNRNYANSLHE